MIKLSNRDFKKAYYGNPKIIVDIIDSFSDLEQAKLKYPKASYNRCNYPNGCIVLKIGEGNSEGFNRYHISIPEEVEYVENK